MVKGRQHHIFLDNGPLDSERVRVFEFQSHSVLWLQGLWSEAWLEAEVLFCMCCGCMSHGAGLLSLESDSAPCQTEQDRSEPVLWF